MWGIVGYGWEIQDLLICLVETEKEATFLCLLLENKSSILSELGVEVDPETYGGFYKVWAPLVTLPVTTEAEDVSGCE